jgi:hypothetical protein
VFNICEQPWILLMCAVFTYLVIGTLHSIFPEKQRRWHILIAIGVAVIAFGIDALIDTDLEKIQKVINSVRKGTENEDSAAIDAVIDPDYRDSLHRSKPQLMRRVQRELSSPLVKKTAEIGLTVEISPPSTATATLSMTILFEPDSHVAKAYKPGFMTLIRMGLKKQTNGQWLVNEIEIVEVDKQPIGWGKIPPLS